ncbi:hypothetical protein KR009_002437 [Drosophila setifemur]|nr:hypothetical protein KR009_002437 [Drosophila setifemur]
MSAPSCKLLLKQMPCSLEELAQLIQECKLIVPRSLNSYGRKRALIEYGDQQDAQKALEQLQGLSEQLDKPLSVSSFGPKTQQSAPNKSTQTKPAATESPRNPGQKEQQQQQEIDKCVRRLYACNNHCDFTQPPPPYLSYSYPPINTEILSGISHCLLENSRFYTQVLHLMNRMNLEPPFKKRSSGLGIHHLKKNVSTQTEELPSESESELESEDEGRAKRQRLLPPKSEETKEKVLKRTRQMLQQAASQGSHSHTKQANAAPTFSAPKIELKLPQNLIPASLKPEKRLSTAELQDLPVYKNYRMGEPSNKLYIKNLDKSVDEQQLRDLYSQFTAASSPLDIKVMQQGRMKGQAFVTFLQPIEPDVVAKALSETNGLIWNQKPMIVCYGKQQ